MRLELATEADALTAAEAIHQRMIFQSPAYAQSVAAGQTTAWAKPYTRGGKWYVNCKPRCLGALTKARTATLKPFSDASVELPFKALLATGSMVAGSNALVLISDPGFNVGDPVIVEIGGEAGAGKRGTRGVGGTWPSLSYADEATRLAAVPPENNTFAWDEDTGTVHRYVDGAWTSIAESRYYTHKAIPKALVTTIAAMDGLTLTLADAAEVSTTGASVHFDNAPAFNERGQISAGPDGPNTLVIPAGEFAIADRLQVHGHDNWAIIGAGPAKSTLFSPKGVPSAYFRFTQSNHCIARGFHLKGNVGLDGFGLQYWAFAAGEVVTDTSLPQGDSYPRGVVFNQCEGGIASGLKVTDVFHMGIGSNRSADVWAYDCEVYVTEAMPQYIQWMYLWADSDGGGAVDCLCDSAFLTGGFEGFRSDGVQFIRMTVRNASGGMNSTGNWLIEGLDVTIEAGSQFNAGFSSRNPVININSNIQPPSDSLKLGGTIRNPKIVQQGYVNDANDTLQAIVVNAQCPNVVVEGTYPDGTKGYFEAPDYAAPSELQGAVAVNSDNAAVTVRGIRAVGTTRSEARGNIHLSDGLVENCVADRITGNAALSGNMTNAEYEAA